MARVSGTLSQAAISAGLILAPLSVARPPLECCRYSCRGRSAGGSSCAVVCTPPRRALASCPALVPLEAALAREAVKVLASSASMLDSSTAASRAVKYRWLCWASEAAMRAEPAEADRTTEQYTLGMSMWGATAAFTRRVSCTHMRKAS